MIIIFICASWMIDIAFTATSLSTIHRIDISAGSMHVCISDAVKVKSRMFVMGIGIMFILLNIYELYYRIFTDWDQGVALFKYTIQGDKYTVMNDYQTSNIHTNYVIQCKWHLYPIQRRKQKLMIFATGNIYRETGTASKKVEDKQYSMNIKSENIEEHTLCRI